MLISVYNHITHTFFPSVNLNLTPTSLFSFWNLCFHHRLLLPLFCILCKWITQNAHFRTCLLYLKIMFLRFTHVYVVHQQSFVWIGHKYFVFMLIDIYIVSCLWLLPIKLLCTDRHMSYWGHMCSFLISKYEWNSWGIRLGSNILWLIN